MKVTKNRFTTAQKSKNLECSPHLGAVQHTSGLVHGTRTNHLPIQAQQLLTLCIRKIILTWYLDSLDPQGDLARYLA